MTCVRRFKLDVCGMLLHKMLMHIQYIYLEVPPKDSQPFTGCFIVVEQHQKLQLRSGNSKASNTAYWVMKLA